MQQGLKLKEIYETHGGVFGESLYESALEHVNILNDGLFKMLFGTDKNKDLTIDFLNCFFQEELGHAIWDVEFIDKEPIAEIINEKNIRYDVCLILETGEKVDLEVQAVNRRDMENRSVYYWVKLCKTRLEVGQRFKELKPCITLNIVNFSLFKEFDEPFSSWYILNARTHQRLSSVLSINFLELTKFKQDADIRSMSKTDKWLAFLSNELTFSQKERIAMSDPSIKKACDEVKKYMSDEAQFMKYFNQEMNELDIAAEKTAAYDDGREEGIEKGREEGEIKKRVQIVLNMLKEGLDLSFVKRMTGSTDDEIYKIARQYSIQVR